MKKMVLKKWFYLVVILLTGINFTNAQDLYAPGETIYVKNADHGIVGNKMSIYTHKKGYLLAAQDYRYDYAYIPKTFRFKKPEHLKVFVKNLNTVLNVWDFENLSKEDFPDSIVWEGVGYSLEKSRKTPDTLVIKLNTDLDVYYDTYFTMNKEEVKELYNLFYTD